LNEGWLPGDWSEGLLNAAKARAAAKSAPISVANAAPTVPVVANPITSVTKSPIFTPEIIEGGSSNYKAFTVGEDSTKFTFKGLEFKEGSYSDIINSNMSDIADSAFVVPTTPQGLIEAALKLNPNDKSLLSLLDNFKAKQYGPAETELLDFMVASSYINKSNQISSKIDTEGLALVIAHLSGDKNATSLLNNKKTILNEILAKENSGAASGFGVYTGSATPADVNQVPVFHSTKYDINYDKDGNIITHPSGYYRVGEGQLPRGEGTIETSGAPRPTVHTTLGGAVASHMWGEWGSSNNKIISTLGGMMDANGKPLNLNPSDTWWPKSPGEPLVFPKDTTSAITIFTDEIDYAKELISRGIIKEGDRVPIMASDPKSNNIMHLRKENYTDEELQQIADLVKKQFDHTVVVKDGKLLTEVYKPGQEPTFEEYFTPNKYLDRVTEQLAKENIGINTIPMHIDGWGTSDRSFNAQLEALANDLNIPDGIHMGSPYQLHEASSDFMTTSINKSEKGVEYTHPMGIDGLRFSALAGHYETPKVDKNIISQSEAGSYIIGEPLTIADLEPYLNPTDFAASKIPTPSANTSNITVPPTGSITNPPNLFNNEDTPAPPKIIKSTISAGKLKQLKKFMDPDLLMATGGLVPGLGNKDTIASMLTPGEFVIKKSAVEAYGANNLAKINDGISTDSSVYNYSLSVNVNGNNLNADDIASTVMQKIKYIDGQRIRGQR
jgi:hypothetical protein